MSSRVFALLDCDNFFVSCERLFEPDLRNQPVAVLSNNDGCVVARSNEVKALGVPMGAPHFKHEALFKANKVKTFSANFPLYGDMSQRVVKVLEQFSPHTEIYSVDECFMEIGDLRIKNYEAWARQVAATIKKSTGLPVSIGVGSSKTLAKAATERAKKEPALRGGASLAVDGNLPAVLQELKHEEYLKWLPLGDIWGIGRRYSWKLHNMGLSSAYDLVNMPDNWVLKHLTVRGLRTVKELRGESIFELDTSAGDEPQKSIMSSRSFGRNIRSISQLEMAVASFAARAAARLRRKNELAWEVTAFIRSGRHVKRRHSASKQLTLKVPSADTAEIIRGSLDALRQAYNPDFSYRKAGVILTNLIPAGRQQMALGEISDTEHFINRDKLMHTMDHINERFGKHALKHASEGVNRPHKWHSKRENRSPSYTTDWHQLPRVKV